MKSSHAIELHRVAASERLELDPLIDVYLAELSAHRERPVGPTDAASYQYLPLYWREPGRHPFFIQADGERIGFVLVREVAAEAVIEMSEFYIRRESRRSGLGRATLAEVWRRFPGRWRLLVHDQNRAAALFWPKCIGEAATGPIETRPVTWDDGRRTEYTFEVGPA